MVESTLDDAEVEVNETMVTGNGALLLMTQ